MICGGKAEEEKRVVLREYGGAEGEGYSCLMPCLLLGTSV